ncbi:MAG: group II intron reverse transcriptase/maturase [Bacteroidetes bacterium]|nr:group II intron reverse transcriptase/maturase [Bacteroidota bacterium]
MEDTQRSQTISTNNQGIALQTVRDSNVIFKDSVEGDNPLILAGGSSLARVRILAQENPEMVFTSLAHRVNMGLLRDSYKEIRKSDAAGVDKMTAKEYAENLDENLYNLFERLRRGQYVAVPVKRIWIEKDDGKLRPIGIPALEDKIVQKAVATIMYVIYDVNFYEFSYGFRKGYSQHMALQDLREQCRQKNINWIVDADISGFFDNIDKKLLVEFIKQRVNDGRILRLIGKWLNAGVCEEGKMKYPETGTPQGGVISPLLSNIFLHYVLDTWFVKEVQPRLKGRCFIIRFADDFIIGCESKEDSERVMEVLPKRFERFGLSLNSDKTSLVRFGKPAKRIRSDKKNGTFDFLGFTFYWSKSRQGFWVIKKKTIGKRLRRFTKSIWSWCKKNRHMAIKDQYDKLCAKLRGYYQYYGVRSNFKALEVVFEYTERAWRSWLSRRDRDGNISWEKFKKIKTTFPFPKPRIVHNI